MTTTELSNSGRPLAAKVTVPRRVTSGVLPAVRRRKRREGLATSSSLARSSVTRAGGATARESLSAQVLGW